MINGSRSQEKERREKVDKEQRMMKAVTMLNENRDKRGFSINAVAKKFNVNRHTLKGHSIAHCSKWRNCTSRPKNAFE